MPVPRRTHKRAPSVLLSRIRKHAHQCTTALQANRRTKDIGQRNHRRAQPPNCRTRRATIRDLSRLPRTHRPPRVLRQDSQHQPPKRHGPKITLSTNRCPRPRNDARPRRSHGWRRETVNNRHPHSIQTPQCHRAHRTVTTDRCQLQKHRKNRQAWIPFPGETLLRHGARTGIRIPRRPPLLGNHQGLPQQLVLGHPPQTHTGPRPRTPSLPRTHTKYVRQIGPHI